MLVLFDHLILRRHDRLYTGQLLLIHGSITAKKEKEFFRNKIQKLCQYLYWCEVFVFNCVGHVDVVWDWLQNGNCYDRLGDWGLFRGCDYLHDHNNPSTSIQWQTQPICHYLTWSNQNPILNLSFLTKKIHPHLTYTINCGIFLSLTNPTYLNFKYHKD